MDFSLNQISKPHYVISLEMWPEVYLVMGFGDRVETFFSLRNGLGHSVIHGATIDQNQKRSS